MSCYTPRPWTGPLLPRRRAVAALVDLDACIAAVEHALRLHAEGRTLPPAVLGVPAGTGTPVDLAG